MYFKFPKEIIHLPSVRNACKEISCGGYCIIIYFKDGGNTSILFQSREARDTMFETFCDVLIKNGEIKI